MYLVWGVVPSAGGVPGPRGVYLVLGGVPGLGGVPCVEGGVPGLGDVPGPGVYLVRGVHLVWGGVPGPGGSTWSKGVYLAVSRGVYLVRYSPPVDRITDACKNITLPQVRCGR